MATTLERLATPAIPGRPEVPGPEIDQALASDVELDWDWDELESPFPWGKLFLIGALLGIGVGLPLIPMSEAVIAAVGSVAGALGCPFHAAPPDLR